MSYYCITALKTTRLCQVCSSVRQSYSILIGIPAYDGKNSVLLDVFLSKVLQRMKYFSPGEPV